ncbi:MAG: TatD family hydrolase [Taibaiella sp.]|nr:TatD family hydrolase [Taibaiella sp.]
MDAYIDIHTHKQSATGLSVINRHEDFAQALDGVTCSLGVHPWYIQADAPDTQLANLRQYAALPNVIAIGECGLDKATDTDWQLQGRVFAAQIALANELNKPLVIHCVRAYEEVLDILHDSQVAVPVIFHGFNKNAQLAERLINAGYYLSFGAALLNEGSYAAKALTHIPLERIFLETDDSAVPIEQIYETAAGWLKTGKDALILQLQNNFSRVFNI